ncbi:hypothetical protein C8Q74DRAFT_454453 [Fomes fomentarius]|nr:hypothetical protein C8Q74DRAFT_454453 [Fomes fomentarius]
MSGGILLVSASSSSYIATSLMLVLVISYSPLTAKETSSSHTRQYLTPHLYLRSACCLLRRYRNHICSLGHNQYIPGYGGRRSTR